MTKPNLQTGICGEATAQVTDTNTAIAMDSGDLPVLSTVAMLGLMEKAAYQSVVPYLSAGCHTVGIALDVRHLSASPLGADIRAQSELIEIDGKRLIFSVNAYDNAGLIGTGTHQRFIVERDPFLENTAKKLQ